MDRVKQAFRVIGCLWFAIIGLLGVGSVAIERMPGFGSSMGEAAIAAAEYVAQEELGEKSPDAKPDPAREAEAARIRAEYADPSRIDYDTVKIGGEGGAEY